MPIFVAAIGGMLLNIVGSVVGRVLVALGLGMVTYTGLSFTLDWLLANALSSFDRLPPHMLPLLGILKVGVCINIVTSAMVVRLVMQGLTGDSFRKLVQK